MFPPCAPFFLGSSERHPGRPSRPSYESARTSPCLHALRAHGYALRVAPSDSLQALLASAFPDADELSVVDRTGGGDHFQVTVASGRFDGLSLVEQHRLVYAALEAPLADGTIHELRIKTKGAS
jgi:stress-induced morphogen